MRILIVGWYGTETVGDKAILAGILSRYLERGNPEIVVASLNPWVTKRTLSELRLSAKVIPTYSRHFVKYAALSDDVVMGGGPLMDLEVLSIPLWAFRIAKLFNRNRIIYGCGLGPLTQKRYLAAVKEILQNASEIRLRDSDSVRWAKKITRRLDIQLVTDPAMEYVKVKASGLAEVNSDQTNELACFIRRWPREYATDLDSENYRALKSQFERNLAMLIRKISKRLDLVPTFYAMHVLSIGGDDRIFNRAFVKEFFSDSEVRVVMEPSTVESIITAIQQSRFCICMRFHSVLFAHTIGAKFAAVDYTRGGKIAAFLDDNGIERKLLKFDDIAMDSEKAWSRLTNSEIVE